MTSQVKKLKEARCRLITSVGAQKVQDALDQHLGGSLKRLCAERCYIKKSGGCSGLGNSGEMTRQTACQRQHKEGEAAFEI